MRSRITTFSKSNRLMAVLGATVALALVGTTVGYAAMTKDVTLTLDGRSTQVSAMGATVGDVLESEGITLTDKDLVAPAVTETVNDGSKITVQFGRPLELSIDGSARTYWVNSTDVDGALAEIGRRFSGADLSTSRSAAIGRDGLALDVVTPKTVHVTIADKRTRKKTVAALTVSDVLAQLGVTLDEHDKVRPSLETVVESGDKIVYTDFRVTEKDVDGEVIKYATIERTDDSMTKGETEVIREGRNGVRDVTYELVFRNGTLVKRKVLSQDVSRKAVPAIVRVGTAEPANFAGGDTVWDRLAQCESGGNWAINTGNGYYGGLQFSASTWASVGGTGLPHQHSREEQIKRGRILQARAGWGQWPHCASRLGLL